MFVPELHIVSPLCLFSPIAGCGLVYLTAVGLLAGVY